MSWTSTPVASIGFELLCYLVRSRKMPEISRFFGIVVYMYWRDHEPAHFHVDYSGQKAEIAIDPVGLLKGKLSPKAVALVTEWAAIHQKELLEDWELAKNKQPLLKSEPLR